jgi:uncharacterized membrane protein
MRPEETCVWRTGALTLLCEPEASPDFSTIRSAYLSFRKHNDLVFSRRYLLTRGIWFVLLEFTLINFALWFDIHFRLFILEVIGAIGFSFIILALMLKMKPFATGVMGLLIILSHNMLQTIALPGGKFMSLIFSSLFRPALIQFYE